jgi:hypothetical protein
MSFSSLTPNNQINNFGRINNKEKDYTFSNILNNSNEKQIINAKNASLTSISE